MKVVKSGPLKMEEEHKPQKVRLSINTGSETHTLDVSEEYWDGIQNGLQGFTGRTMQGLWDGASEDVLWSFNAMGPDTLLVVGDEREILLGSLSDVTVEPIST